MPASIAANQQVMRELGERDSVLFFPVSMRPLQDILHRDALASFTDVNGKWNVVTNDDTGEILAVHKDKYRLQKNADIFGAFDESLAGNNLDLRGMTVKDELAYSGGRAIRTYRMPAHRVDIGNGDVVDLMLKVQNSYDGSRRFGMTFGAFRVLCSNGLVIGDTMLDVRAKHTTGLDIATVTDKLSDAIEVFEQSSGQWAQWKETPCPHGVPENVLGQIPGISETLKERIFEYYRSDSLENGANLWTLFNAMTYWSSHEEVKGDAAANKSALVLAREEKVKRALQHPVFQMAA